jgi:hypothetical protein
MRGGFFTFMTAAAQLTAQGGCILGWSVFRSSGNRLIAENATRQDSREGDLMQ